tara:strand:+ start:15656 stop:15925 length:270 start_codon:yes stop_codon:yes gene_type:complete
MADGYSIFNIGMDYLEDIQTQISLKIAKKVNKYDESSRLDMGCELDTFGIFKLIGYKNILESIEQCSSCYSDLKIEDVVSKIKTNLNKI